MNLLVPAKTAYDAHRSVAVSPIFPYVNFVKPVKTFVSRRISEQFFVPAEKPLLRERRIAVMNGIRYYFDNRIYMWPVFVKLTAFCKNNIFHHRQCRDQHKMLVHHPYPVCNRINRAVQCNFFPPDQDFSACWLQQSVEHIHHCRFSCTVFTYNTFNLLFFYIQINMIICDKIVKLFGQINRLYHAVHIAASFLSK